MRDKLVRRWNHFLFHLGDACAAFCGLVIAFFVQPETGLMDHPFRDGWKRGDDG